MMTLLRANGVEVKQAGVKAPWQIGRAERHGGLLKAMMKRVIATGHLIGDFAVGAAATQCASVKNSSFVHGGFSPAQWVLGRLPFDGTSLASEQNLEQLGLQQAVVDGEDQFSRSLLIRQWAKEAYVYVDSSQRIGRAMLRQSHPLRGPYQTGDLVSYHRRGRWFGPARVLAPEGKSSLWLVHGGMTVLVSDTCCRPASVEEVRRREASENRPAWNRTGSRRKRKFEEFLEDDEEDLPFSNDIPQYEEGESATNQVPYFDFTMDPTASAEPPAIEDAAMPGQPDLEE